MNCDVGGPLDLDNFYDISNGRDDNSAVERNILKKKYLDTIYWEGECLILRRMHEHRDYALVMKRYLEDEGNTIRLVSVHHNLITNEEVESISFFSKSGPSPYVPSEIFKDESNTAGNSAINKKPVDSSTNAATSGDNTIPARSRDKSVSFGEETTMK